MKTFLILLLAIVLLGIYFRHYFLENDATTSIKKPLQFKVLARIPENQGHSMNWKGGVYIPAKKMSLPPDQAFKIVKEVAVSMPLWTIISVDESEYTIEAIATTSLLHFHDDVAIKVVPDDEGSIVHMRSKSRIGIGDLGENARRIKAFFSRLSGFP